MKKERVIRNLEAAWAEFEESYAGLTDAELIEPGVTDDWSVKDILAHVSWWEEEALKHLPYILEGGRPQRYSVLYGGIDAFNAQMTAKRQAVPLSQIEKDQADIHMRLMRYLETISEEQFTTETRFRRRLRLDTYSHYPIHTKAIREWRERKKNNV